jgi:hypothetical protein
MRKLLQTLVIFVGFASVLTACDELFFGTSILHSPLDTDNQAALPEAGTPLSTTAIHDFESLVAALQASGATVEATEEVTQPFFTVSGQIIQVNDADVQVFEFSSETEATAAVSEISPDGGSTATMMINWIAPPHFYQAGKIIVLYVGDNAEVLSLSTSFLGEPFAGQ